MVGSGSITQYGSGIVVVIGWWYDDSAILLVRCWM